MAISNGFSLGKLIKQTTTEEGGFAGISIEGASGGGASVTTADTPPANPSAGDLWFNSSTLKTYVYYNDGTTSQWVVTNAVGTPGPQGPAGADGAAGADATVSYANTSSFPTSGNTAGDMAFAQDTKALYVWDGTEWDRVSSGAQSLPEWTTPLNSNYLYKIGDSADTITVEATDPDGFPINYGFTTDSANPASATITQGTGANSNQFTITPDAATTGEFSLRVTADDGVNKIKSLSTITIFNSALLDLSGGTGGTAGQTVYTAPSGAVVTSSDPTYSSSPNYYLEYLFDGTTSPSGGTTYWLSNNASSGTLTIDLSNQVTNGAAFSYLEKIVVYPYSRSDSFTSVTAVETSSDGTNWTAVTGWTWGTYTTGQSEEIMIERNATYVRLSLSRSGQWGLSMCELEIWGA